MDFGAVMGGGGGYDLSSSSSAASDGRSSQFTGAKVLNISGPSKNSPVIPLVILGLAVFLIMRKRG